MFFGALFDISRIIRICWVIYTLVRMRFALILFIVPDSMGPGWGAVKSVVTQRKFTDKVIERNTNAGTYKKTWAGGLYR